MIFLCVRMIRVRAHRKNNKTVRMIKSVGEAGKGENASNTKGRGNAIHCIANRGNPIRGLHELLEESVP